MAALRVLCWALMFILRVSRVNKQDKPTLIKHYNIEKNMFLKSARRCGF